MVEMRVLRQIAEKRVVDRMRNEEIREELKQERVLEKVKRSQARWRESLAEWLKTSAKSAKVVLRKNLALYGISVSADFAVCWFWIVLGLISLIVRTVWCREKSL